MAFSASGYYFGGTQPAPGAGALPYRDLAEQANQFMTGQAIAPFQANLPQYATNVGQRSQNTNQMLKGQLPDDVIQQIQQQAAERGIATGSPGSNNANSAYLRSLGLNSLQMMGQGSQELSRSIADTPVPQLWNPMSLYVPQVLGQQEMAAAQAGRTAGAGGARQGGGITLPPSGNTNYGFNGPMMGQGPLSVSGPQGGGPSAPLTTDGWWNTYGNHAPQQPDLYDEFLQGSTPQPDLYDEFLQGGNYME